MSFNTPRFGESSNAGLNPVGWVSPQGRNLTNHIAIPKNVGLRDEAANPTYKTGVLWPK
jgi:hypothetical protein